MTNRWLERQKKDAFVKRAQVDGYRARAAYKLLALQEKYHFLKPGMTVVDLGAAPGSWCQVAVNIVGSKGRVIACDLLDFDPLATVDFIRGDFDDETVAAKLNEKIGECRVDVVLSDMAPNLSGNTAIDQPRILHLAELASAFACRHLKEGGAFVCKIFQGPGTDAYGLGLKRHFKRFKWVKPEASRKASREMYALALDFRRRAK